MVNPFVGLFTRLRTYTALASTAVLNLRSFGVDQRQLCSYGFNCHGCSLATTTCPIGVFAFGSAVRALPRLALAMVLAVGVVLGRLVCGYACPFGLLQDLLHRIPTPKLRLPRFLRYGKYVALALMVFLLPYIFGMVPLGYLETGKPEVTSDGSELEVTVSVRNPGTTRVDGVDLFAVYTSIETGEEVYRSQEPIQYEDITVDPGETVLLPAFRIPNQLTEANLSIELPQGRLVQTPVLPAGYFCKICPNGTLTAHLPGYFPGEGETTELDGIYGQAGDNWLRLSVFVVFLLAVVLISRAFCRVACPLGAIYALTSPFALARVRVAEASCVNCGLCDKTCPVDLDVRREAGGPECIACGDCITACPKDSIQREFGFGKPCSGSCESHPAGESA